MKLHDITNYNLENPWWQYFIYFDQSKNRTDLEYLIRSIDYYSPGGRVIVYDATESYYSQTNDRLSYVAEKLFSTHLISIQEDQFASLGHKLTRHTIVKQLLDLTHLPVLSLLPDSFVTADLSLLPVHLQKCDVSLLLRLGSKKKTNRVFTNTMWHRPNERSRVFLENVISHLARKDKQTNSDEKDAVYNALINCQDFLKVTGLPSVYADWSLNDTSYIWSGLSGNKVCRKHVERSLSSFDLKTETPPDTLVFFPRQDLGTKSSLEDNSYKTRSLRAARPGRIYWRYASRLVATVAEKAGQTCRIVTLPQWQIKKELLDAYPQVTKFYVPHLIRAQLDHPKANFYMQELLPMLFTLDPSGWGATSQAYLNRTFEKTEVDKRASELIEQIRTTGLTKAPQKRQEVGKQLHFDLLAPLQVPNDDALVYHSETTLEEYISKVAEFAENEKVKTLIRKHPYDLTDFFIKMQQKYSSEYVLFGEKGHIHEAIMQAQAVCVINSGVGFEAMLLGQPVLCFGKAVYEPVVFNVRQDGIKTAYQSAIREPRQVRIERYEKFISWYAYHFGLKVDERIVNLSQDRCTKPFVSENPFHAILTLELNSKLKGYGLSQLPRKISVPRFNANIAYKIERGRKLSKRTFNRVNKRTIDRINTQFKKQLMSLLDPSLFEGKKIALVGNAASLKKTNRGKEIDKHDLIIRMNLGYPLIVRKDADPKCIPTEWIYGVFTDQKSSEQDQLLVLKPETPNEISEKFCYIDALGTRTDLWSCSTSDRTRQTFFKPLFQALAVACHPNYHHLGIKFILNGGLSYLPENLVYDLREKLGVEPTSGLIWIEYLRQRNIESLSLYGFDFFDSGHIARRSKNILQATGKWPHNPDVERKYVLELVTESKSKILLN